MTKLITAIYNVVLGYVLIVIMTAYKENVYVTVEGYGLILYTHIR